MWKELKEMHLALPSVLPWKQKSLNRSEQSDCKNNVPMIYEDSSCSWLADNNQLTANVNLKQMVNVKNRKLIKILCNVADRSTY